MAAEWRQGFISLSLWLIQLRDLYIHVFIYIYTFLLYCPIDDVIEGGSATYDAGVGPCCCRSSSDLGNKKIYMHLCRYMK